MHTTYIWSKGEIAMNKEDIWASKSKVSHQVTGLGRGLYGEVLPEKNQNKTEIILKKKRTSLRIFHKIELNPYFPLFSKV